MIYVSDTGSSKDPFSTKPSVEVIQGDCREVVPTLGHFDFLLCDPPFNFGMAYRGYVDKSDDFPEFMAEWIKVCWDACDGVMALHGPDDLEACRISRIEAKATPPPWRLSRGHYYVFS